MELPAASFTEQEGDEVSEGDIYVYICVYIYTRTCDVAASFAYTDVPVVQMGGEVSECVHGGVTHIYIYTYMYIYTYAYMHIYI